MRFRPEQHLRRQADIRAVRERGSRSDWRFFTCWSLIPKEGSGGHAASAFARVAVVASKAAIGNAIERNRAKRHLREVFRRHQKELPAGDHLLIARTAIKFVPFSELEQRFVAACSHLQGRVRP
ncbi:MAG TPA: ribonuclease P protein component [Opitutaceae bacterium]